MKRKMCKWFKTCSARKAGIPRRMDSFYCRGKNNKCEIIPKRKPRYKRVKAWASVDGKYIVADNVERCGDVPCFIMIDRKHMEGK